MRRARASITLAASLVSCCAGAAHAAPGHFELTWSAPDACPSSARVEERVEQILNRPLRVRDDELLSVRAVVAQPEGERPWRVELETSNGRRRARRTLEGASCDELANATALWIVILLEANVDSQEPKPPLPAQKAAQKPALTGEKPVAVGTAPHVPLGIFAGALNGLLPAWSFGLGLESGIEWRALRWGVAVAGWLPVEQTTADSDTQGARFRLLSAQTELCWLPQLHPRLAAGPCSGAAFAHLNAVGFGPGVHAHEQRATFVSLTAGGRLSLLASPQFSFSLDADAVVPLGSPEFVFEGGAPALIHTPGMGAQLAVGAQFVLGRRSGGE